ncbi:MAG TPA: TetR family transcriptional regulator [Candidatus Binataceae bacterium]
MPRSGASRAGAKVVQLHRAPDTRDRVLQVAQALFAERGYRGTSLRDIARRIGIKAPSLLHHFPSKRQLYLAVLDRIFEGLEDAAGAVLMSRESRQERTRKAITGAIDFIASRTDSIRLIWKEMAEESGVGRQLLKRRVPPLFSMAVNFIFRGQREGKFRTEIDPFHFLLSLNSITLGYFTTAAMVKRLWNVNLLEPSMIARRKREVIDLVERTLFVPGAGANSK